MQAVLKQSEYDDIADEELTFATRQQRIGARLARQEAIQDLCEVMGIAVSPEQSEALARMSLSDLEALRQHIKTQRRWP